MIRFLVVGLALMLASLVGRLVRGADATVRAPATMPACTYFLLDASPSVASRRMTWQLTEADADVAVYRSGDGRQVVLYVPSPRTLCVTLLAVDSDNSTDAHTVCVKITGDAVPGPVPTPGPPVPSPVTPAPVVPTPVAPIVPAVPVRPVEPDLPQGQFGLAKATRTETLKLTHASRHTEIPKVIAQLERLRDRIRSGDVNVGSLLSLKAGLDALQKENKQALGDSLKYWTNWGSWWAGQMKDLYLAGRLAKAADWIAAIEETLQGLRSVIH